MGDRVSVAFTDGKDTSVVLFDHWGGREIVDRVRQYLKELERRRKQQVPNLSTPFDRGEPGVVMVDFIRWYTRDQDPNYFLYLGATESDGDNSDNGHYVFHVLAGTVQHVVGAFE